MSFLGTAKKTSDSPHRDGDLFATPFARAGSYRLRIKRVRDAALTTANFPPFTTQAYYGTQINSRRFLIQLQSLFNALRRARKASEAASERNHQVGRGKMPSSCKEIRAALAQCLQESECVMVYRNKAADCLRPPLVDTLPTKCQQLKKGYGECKRGMVDMRKRFRGNQPIAVSKELEGGAENPSHQLYGGKPAFSTGVKTTSGNEPEEPDWRELENEKYRKGQQ